MNINNNKKILFTILISLMFLPLIEMNIGFIEFKPLKGAFTLTEKPDSISKNWFSEKYQTQYDKYFNDHLGFRNFLVRLNNQIKFSLYRILSAKNTVIGKNDILYQYYYINSYLGMDYVGDSIIKDEVNKIQFIQKELDKINKKFLYIIAPGKAAIYSNDFPLKYDTITKSVSNYESYIKHLKNKQINVLDLRKYLVSIKDTSQYPLFPKNGTHWSGYSVALVADTMSKHIGNMLNKKLVDISFNSGKLTNKHLKYTDNDIGDALNLLFELDKWKMFYPKINFNVKNKSQATCLIIGDSFAQSFYGFDHYYLNMFSQKSRYFYYYKTVFWPNVKEKKLRKIEGYTIFDLIKDKDIIIILCTDHNLKKHGFGLTNDLYNYFKGTIEGYNIHEINKIIQNIKDNEKWLNKVKIQAKERNVNIEEMLLINAKYIINNKK